MSFFRTTLASPGPQASPPQLPNVHFPPAKTESWEEPRPGAAEGSGGGGLVVPGVPRPPEGAQQEARKKEDPAKMLQPWALALPLLLFWVASGVGKAAR